MDTQTFDDQLEEIAEYPELDKQDKKRLTEIQGRWNESIVPSAEDMEWIDRLSEVHGEKIICTYLKNRKCTNPELRDPITGAVDCMHLANQKKCKLFKKGERE